MQYVSIHTCKKEIMKKIIVKQVIIRENKNNLLGYDVRRRKRGGRTKKKKISKRKKEVYECCNSEYFGLNRFPFLLVC